TPPRPPLTPSEPSWALSECRASVTLGRTTGLSLSGHCRIPRRMAQTSPAGPREALWPDEKGIVMRLIFRATEIAVVLGALTATLTGAGQPAATAAAATGHRANGSAASPASPWSQTDYNAAASRANLTEQT